MNRILVSKFGGTSVEDYDAMINSAQIVAQHPNKHLVVVSAIAGATNLLEKIARVEIDNDADIYNEVKHLIEDHKKISLRMPYCPHVIETLDQVEGMLMMAGWAQLREYSEARANLILAFGEDMSSALFTQAIKSCGVNAEYIDSRNLIRTTDSGNPELMAIKAHANHYLLGSMEDKVYVTQGFVGSNSIGITTTLGRGGSDYTASLLAEAVHARQLNIWTDVVGVYDSDPNQNPQAVQYESITYEMAAKLASDGAKVLHPKTMEPAQRGKIKIYVGSSRTPEMSGTLITSAA